MKIEGFGYGLTVADAQEDAKKHLQSVIGYVYENRIEWGIAEVEVALDYTFEGHPHTRVTNVNQRYTYEQR